MRILRTTLFFLPIALFAPRARATPVELEGAAGATTYASTWRGDYGLGSTLRAGVRFAHVFAGDFQVWESYASVNHRANTGLSLGVTGYLPLQSLHPYARLFAIHQHEEGLVSVANAPFGTLFGIGAGIRHRAGGGLTLGTEIPFHESDDKRLSWVLIAEANGVYFPDATLGPSGYFGIDLGVGVGWLLQ
jgi:hypothetical protein